MGYMDAAIYGSMGAGIGTLFNMGSSAFNWGLGNKSADRQKSAIRHLRRREYQDMVFSMKQAGLNPILAVGAAPGHSAAAMAPAGGPSVNVDIAGNRQAGVAEAKLPAENKLTTAKAMETEIAGVNRMFERANILQQYDLGRAEILSKVQGVKTNKALEALYGAQAIKEGASRGKLDAETNAINTFGPSGTSWPGMIRAALGGDFGKFISTAKEAAENKTGWNEWKGQD